MVFLGLTSLFTDISAEMVNAVLPLYLTYELRWTPLQFGLFDGIYQAMAALFRSVGAAVADRRRRYKEVAAVGYTVSALCKLGLLAVGNAWAASTAILFLDRTGKGIRTAPRDALISFGAGRDQLAWAFGVHRTLDTAGVLIGPLIAFALLTAAPGSFDAVFVTSFCAAVIGLAVLGLFVQNHGGPGLAPNPSKRDAASDSVRTGRRSRTERVASRRAVLDLLAAGPFRSLAVAAGLLALATVGDNLLYLTLQRRLELRTGFFPLLFVGTAAVYLVLAAPVGRLADRVGRMKVLVGGYAMLAGVYAVVLRVEPGPVWLMASLGLFGAYYAATDGVLMAMASSLLPEGLRSSGLALLTTAVALCRAVASVMFGGLWSWQGSSAALGWYLAALVAAVAVAVRLLGRRPELAPVRRP